jgi:membrane associated rhomboid family serine protease
MSYENYQPKGYRVLPEVVKNLLIINGIMYLATLVLRQQGVDLIDMLGLHYFASEKFKVYQIFTYMFLHDSGSIMHILLNMLALYMFGSAVENVWGGKRFLQFYLLTGLGAAVAHYAIVYFQLNPEISFFNAYINANSPEEMTSLLTNEAFKYPYSTQFYEFIKSNELSTSESISYASQIRTQLLNAPVIIGASGAVYGVLLGYGMLFPNSLLYLFFAIPVKAKYVVVLYGVIELFSGISGGGNVAHFAHLGGLLTGFIIIMIWRSKSKRKSDDFYNPS